ncbi:MAG: ArgE/DapE family deacylase [Gemmatimonadaceae bacterium]|nr:ArgE/DapE family deacylase [Gemmatimonadaceae bacterium]
MLRALVRTDSRNPRLVPGAAGEGAVANLLAEVLTAWGFRVELQLVAPGRPNVIARIGPSGGRRLMFNGHIDVVDSSGMIHAPFDAELRAGRLYGRGASDMKGGVASMCAAAARAADRLEGEVVVAAVVDEEFASEGTRALLASGVDADAAIVTEPTLLCIGPAHRGFTWIELTFRGRAAHGSRYDLGADAIAHAGAVLHELETLQRDVLDRRTHALLGHASLHASTIEGGAGWSTYPDRCVLRVERRTLPGETAEAVLGEFDAACVRARVRFPELDVAVREVLTQDPSDVPVTAPVVRALASALGAEGMEPCVAGVTAWTDAALLNAAGVPAVCFGPGDMGLAHADEEYIEVAQVERATRVLARLAVDWFREVR